MIMRLGPNSPKSITDIRLNGQLMFTQLQSFHSHLKSSAMTTIHNVLLTASNPVRNSVKEAADDLTDLWSNVERRYSNDRLRLDSRSGQTTRLEKLVFTASLLDVQQLKGTCEASSVCDRQVAA